MARFKTLIPRVRTHLAGAPELTVINYLRQAAQQFAQDSQIWNVAIGSIEVSPPAADIELEIAVPSIAPDVDFVLPAGSSLKVISSVRLSTDSEDLDPEAYRYNIPTAKLILERGAVETTGDLTVKAILVLDETTTEYPDFMEQWGGKAIVDYAIYEMMTMPKAEWSDPMLAQEFERKYKNHLAEATVGIAQGGTKRPIRLDPIPFI